MSRMQKIQRGMVIGLIAAGCLVSSGEAVGSSTLPRGYGKDACVTMLHDLKAVGASKRDRDFKLNLIGCDEPEPTRPYMQYHTNRCARAANTVADRLVRDDIPSLSISPNDIGRRIGGVGRVVRNHDCTLHEDWSWS